MSELPDQTLTSELPRPSAGQNVRIELGTPTKTVTIEAGEGGRKRVVKKTVRIVKRIVRKKVPKSVPNSSTGNVELEKDITIKESGSLKPCRQVSTSNIQNSKPGDGNVKPYAGDEDLNKSEPQPMEVEKDSILADAVPESGKMHQSDLTIAEKPLEVVKENSNSIENQNVGKEGVRQDDTGVSVNENAKPIEHWRLGLVVEAGTEGSLEEVLERDVEWSDKATLNEEARTKGALEEVKEVLERDIECSDKVTLSEEMEALERKRRRRTQIFIGGLDKDTKEEDIRPIFEDVGEVMELRLLINRETGKNKGFAFLRFASAADAKKAVSKYSQVEICGKQCGVSLVEGNDTIYLGNIDKKWKTQDVAKLLERAGIDKIDKVTVMADPNDAERNRGFAFVELETSRDAQIAFNKLQKKEVFGKHLQVRVAWAQPLVEPNEEEMQKVKSIFAEYIPLSWDEIKVRDYFKRFGEIENVVISKDLPSSRRKDFAFVNYTSREAALACIMAFRHEEVNGDSSEVKMKVSLARPMPKSKQIKRATNPTIKKPSRDTRKVAHSILKVHEPTTKENPMRSDYGSSKVDRGSSSSSTDELLQLLRHQASTRQTQSSLNLGSSSMESQYLLTGSKRPPPLVRDIPPHFENRGFPRMRFENTSPIPNRCVLSRSLGAPPVPHYQLQGAHASDSVPEVAKHGRPFQTPEQAQYGGASGLYHRCRVEEYKLHRHH
ncbi:heterogeneous nuclear ribonucleoprotein Q-like isoform X4 [Ipomoea triloba]|uniref:heterogeneous nuclear ribonucleoprotein Q-like isoform X4 n=1 Tax=Ipomoea triloba TaxID=35885 RepID=UPI00125E93A5|nr:heterogeneous nuclear ribonucleoprotein Q-like isoform X4 [Ipomoea triloba]